jgi:hypothetical protein
VKVNTWLKAGSTSPGTSLVTSSLLRSRLIGSW